eukprot:9085626-Pyramimonas_sp.AAC.2
MSPRKASKAPTESQDGPKRRPSGPKRLLRRPQEAPKRPPRGPKRSHIPDQHTSPGHRFWMGWWDQAKRSESHSLPKGYHAKWPEVV